MRHVLDIPDLSSADIERVFEIAADLKRQHARGVRPALLAGRCLALLFEKPSLRTRVSFEAGMAQLGGASMFLGEDVGWGSREPNADFAGALTEYVDVVVCRAKSHAKVEELAAHSKCPVVNGLTDLAHPCQALADLFTLRELFESLAGRKIAFVGDANNVASSLARACARLGVRFSIASPPGYGFRGELLRELQQDLADGELEITPDPEQAVRNADCVYTDVWASMGQEAEREVRARAFSDYQVDSRLMKLASPNACFMHCLPARRGEEVTAEVIDGEQSVVMQQAANRMHAQKGLLVWLLNERKRK